MRMGPLKEVTQRNEIESYLQSVHFLIIVCKVGIGSSTTRVFVGLFNDYEQLFIRWVVYLAIREAGPCPCWALYTI